MPQVIFSKAAHCGNLRQLCAVRPRERVHFKPLRSRELTPRGPVPRVDFPRTDCCTRLEPKLADCPELGESGRRLSEPARTKTVVDP